MPAPLSHPRLTRRTALQAGAVGLLNLGLGELSLLRAAGPRPHPAKAVVYVFLNETWDTHGNAFPHLKDRLLPPTDRAVSALLDSTLVVMAGEFGRTPRISTLGQFYKGPGRDHWGTVQGVFPAGGGVRGGRVLGSSDKTGGYPATDPQTPENFAATIYTALGIPKTAAWHDAEARPHFVYHADPVVSQFAACGIAVRCRKRQTETLPPTRCR